MTTGQWHSCGDTTGNRAYCWGANFWGQLGVDVYGGDRLVPRRVRGWLYFKQLSAGFGDTCGITDEAVAYCWGWNGEGQLGDGTTEPRVVPTLVASPD